MNREDRLAAREEIAMDKLTDQLAEEHDCHIDLVDSCPKCDQEARRVYCQFCASRFRPVPGRVPSLTCEPCWLEIRARLGRYYV